MNRIKGGVAQPKGFLVNSLNCGIRKYRHDLGLLASLVPAKAAAVFTKNKVKAAPVIFSQKNIKNSGCRAIIVNSGNANCCTGPKGANDAAGMAASAAKALKVSKKGVLVASTGVIGRALPIKLIEKAVPALAKGLNKNGSMAFARAIMTTDKFPKSLAVKIKIGGAPVTIGGTAKGAGMINPNMATMLSFITTDAAIKKDALKEAFKNAIAKSFNSITVDGAMSTNDCVFILANGMAKNRPISGNSGDYNKFCRALEYITVELAKKIVLDGEGATKFVRIIVKGAKDEADAKTTAYAIANDSLFKTSVYGEDPNWGRIAAAVGYSGAKVEAKKLDIYLNGKKAASGGVRTNADLAGSYKRKHINIVVDLKLGKKMSEVFTCDLTKKYVEINSSYTS